MAKAYIPNINIYSDKYHAISKWEQLTGYTIIDRNCARPFSYNELLSPFPKTAPPQLQSLSAKTNYQEGLKYLPLKIPTSAPNKKSFRLLHKTSNLHITQIFNPQIKYGLLKTHGIILRVYFDSIKVNPYNRQPLSKLREIVKNTNK